MTIALSQSDPAFPPLLRQIPDAPQILHYAGNPPDPRDVYFAIVGTRHPSIYGRQMAHEFASAIASAGYTVVSGLAYGIDAIAHEAALEAGGKTVAVLGSGLNYITPTCNLGLAKKIQKNGTILTEFEPERTPTKYTFPQRNRIIAGMSVATLIVEAPAKSGALITAGFALDYNRVIFAIPGNITQETSHGTNRLIRDCAAHPATCVNDIFEQLNLFPAPKISEKIHAVSEEEESILKILKKSDCSIDDLIRESKLPTSQIIALLSVLELKKRIIIQGTHVVITR